MSERDPIFRKTGFDRKQADAYWTEAWVTQALLSSVSIRGPVLEPACGRGDMAQTLRRAGYDTIASDLHAYGAQNATSGVDFLAVNDVSRHVRSIVTNPPYSHAEEFIRRALRLMEYRHGQVAMLLRHEYDCAGGRRDLFENHKAFSAKITLLRRPRWDLDDPNRAASASPRHNFAWFVWDWCRAPGFSGTSLLYAPKASHA